MVISSLRVRGPCLGVGVQPQLELLVERGTPQGLLLLLAQAIRKKWNIPLLPAHDHVSQHRPIAAEGAGGTRIGSPPRGAQYVFWGLRRFKNLNMGQSSDVMQA
jgi:hypothetical protein